MLRFFAAAILFGTTHAYTAPTQEQRDAVKAWDDIMTSYKRDYEIHKATTDDDWELTVFRILPDS